MTASQNARGCTHMEMAPGTILKLYKQGSEYLVSFALKMDVHMYRHVTVLCIYIHIYTVHTHTYIYILCIYITFADIYFYKRRNYFYFFFWEKFL